MGYIHINKYDSALDVENYNYNVIGKIYTNEVWCFLRPDARNSQYAVMKFRNSAGNIQTGYFFKDGFPGVLSTFGEYPIATDDLWDYSVDAYRKHCIYNVRRATKIYRPDGVTVIDTVSKGGQVAVKKVNAGESGDSKPDWLMINYWRNSTSDSWKAIMVETGRKVNYGYAPIGLDFGSTKNTLSIYGDW